MVRTRVSFLLLAIAVLGGPFAHAQPAPRTLVLPFRTTGVSVATANVSRELLVGSLGDLGLDVSEPPSESPLPQGPEACAGTECAIALGREHGATLVVYGSLSRLGDKIIARLNVVRVDEPAPYYRDQLTATTEEDLDKVMRRFAEGIASGRPNSDRASVESVIQAETVTPARRATRAGPGVRAGFLFPTGGSFGGTDRLTNLHLVIRYETRDFQIESTPVLGFSWGHGNLDWTILDLSVTRIFGTKDFAPYLGLGIGVHGVNAAREQIVTYATTYPPYSYSYPYRQSQSETAPVLDVVAGFIALRTYDFEAVLSVRYHYVFEKFDQVDGNGANGVLVTFGTSR